MGNRVRSTLRARLVSALAAAAALGYISWSAAPTVVSAQTPAPASVSEGTAWTWLGPGNYAGRMRAIAANPNVSLSLLGGAADGGIWRTNDGGASWTRVDDFMPSLAVSTIVYKPGAVNVVLAGTGDGFYSPDAIRGAGIFKSTDGGNTWSQLASTDNSNFAYVNRLAFSGDGTIVLAATRAGLFRSTDEGASWTGVFDPSTAAGGGAGHPDMADVEFIGGSSSRAIASGLSHNAYYSSDGGVTWGIATPTVDASASFHRVETATSLSSPNVVYLSIDVNVSPGTDPPASRGWVPNGQIWRSTDYGHTYAVVNNLAHLSQYGLYEQSLWVDPTDADKVLAGGMDLWMTLDGGTTFTQVSDRLSPAPVHTLGQQGIAADGGYNGTTNRRIFLATNRGVYRADDWTTINYTTGGFTSLDNGLLTEQFRSIAIGPTGKIVGGTEYNGTIVLPVGGGASSWTTMRFNDASLKGGLVAADPGDANYLYGEDGYLQIVRSSDGGATSSYIFGDPGNGTCKAAPYRIDDACSTSPAINEVAPFALDPNNPNTLIAGGESLWRTTDVKTANTATTGPTWTVIKAPSPVGCSPTGTTVCSPVSAIAITPGNSNVIYVAHNNGDVYKTTNGTAGSPSWTRLDGGTFPDRKITRIIIDPSNTSRLFALFEGDATDNIRTSTDAGATWNVASGSGATALPATPVRALAIHPLNSAWLYAGTDQGVFTSMDGGTTWALPQSGPANVRVDDFAWRDSKNILAATHGRGLWTFNTDAACTSATTIAPTSASFSGAGGSGSISVTTTAGCSWTATADASFITITSGSSGTGNGTIAYTVAASSGVGPRNGGITVNGSRFTITQNATVTISPSSLSFLATRMGVSGALVSMSPAQNVTIAFDYGGSAWTATSDQSWAQVSPASGSGTGTVTVSIAAGSVPAGRRLSATITLTIASLGLVQRVPAVLNVTQNVVSTDADGDGKGDLTLFRPGNGTWYTLTSSSGFAGSTSTSFGASGDLPVPGDYDGDGKGDIAVYRPGTGTWYILQSSTGAMVSYVWGAGTDIPVPGDYDGDGRADLAVYRPSNGTWYILTSSSDYVAAKTFQWGLRSDIPIAADYDGDGTTDLTLFRPSTGEWWIKLSKSGFSTWAYYRWGQAGDIPVPGDYDGDSIADLALYRPSAGTWYVLQSKSGFATWTSYQWGVAGDQPVPTDYDGDGKVDYAVYRPSTGTWWIAESTTGFANYESFHWGVSTDTATPNSTVARAITIVNRTVAAGMRNADLDGDGRADITVFRPSSGQWFNLRSNGSSPAAYQWGASGDVPIVSDFDGDGQSDLGVWRPSTGAWYIATSGSHFAGSLAFQFGVSGDMPVVGDFDGDGKADIAIYRPSISTWYIITSGSNYTATLVYQWGVSGDVPVPGDYDGDGVTDVAVYRPSSGIWYIRLSSTGALGAFQWGNSADIPVQADFDGDGKTDVAVYRPSTGNWFVKLSSTAFTTSAVYQWGGVGGDVPVPGDYDGDGKIDLAVFRPSTATWIIATSGSGYATGSTVQWGTAGDIAILHRP